MEYGFWLLIVHEEQCPQPLSRLLVERWREMDRLTKRV